MRYLFIILVFLLPGSLPAKSQNNFVPGEKMKFIIFFGPLNGGIVETSLREAQFKGQRAYHARMEARSIGVADILYKVRDAYEAYFDPDKILPFRSIRDIHEGKYEKYDEVDYDHANNRVFSVNSGEHEVPPDIMDMVTVFYYLRNYDFSKLEYNEVIDITTWFDDEVFPFDMRYRGIETIRTKMGKYNCIKLVPYVEPGRIFESEDDMTIWLSNDYNRVPIRIKFDLIVGSLKCDLIDYSGLKY